jgi:hypothetical protein
MVQLVTHITDSMSLQVVYEPFLSPNLYSIKDIAISDYQYAVFIPKAREYYINASFVNREIPLFSQIANSVHASFSLTTDLVDLVACYSYFIDPMLDFDLSGITETIVENPLVFTHTISGTAYPAYNRVHLAGLGVSFYLFDEFLINADASVKLTPDMDGTIPEVKNGELYYAIQVEKMFPGNIRAQLNFFHKTILASDAKTRETYSYFVQLYLNDIVDDYLIQKLPSQVYVLAHLDTTFLNDTLSVGFNFIYGYSEGAYYLAPRIGYSINDYFTLSAGADFWWLGMPEAFLGRNEKLDNYYLRFSFKM